MKPKILDLFCGGGGASKGYYDAGFDIVGIDLAYQSHYPYTFIKADALDVLQDAAFIAQFDAIHSSPECKAYTNCNLSPKDNYLKLIADVREHLQRIGKPYVIENVMGAKKDLQASLKLCGTMFDLPMQRHRLFETNVFMYPPRPCNHANATIAVYGHSVWDSSLEGTIRKDGRPRPDSVSIEIGRQAMGCPWMNIEELAEAIPPSYTRWIGQFLMEAITFAQEATA